MNFLQKQNLQQTFCSDRSIQPGLTTPGDTEEMLKMSMPVKQALMQGGPRIGTR
jgi:hypothetical protein